MNTKKWIGIVLIVITLLTGCSKSSAPAESTGSEMNDAAAPQAAGVSAEAPIAGQPVVTERKIIQKYYYDLQTKAYNESITHILKIMNEHQGYVAQMEQSGLGENDASYSGRSAYLVLRLPKDKVAAFLDAFVGSAVVKENRLETEDATNQFFDTEARLKTLHIQEERLLKLLSQAAKLEDMIVLESRLSDVRYEIENLQGTLNRLSQLVDYATVEIRLQEVKNALQLDQTKDSYFNRAAVAFMDSINSTLIFLEDLSLFLIAALPAIVLLGFVYWIIKVLSRRFPSLRWIKKKKGTEPSSEVEKAPK